jgi:predicted Ser/Thr protein kinase
VSTTAPSGLHVGRYRLLAKIGEGGMGVVHLAQAPGGQRLALKVLRPHVIGDDEARERLAREVSSLRRVTSPRVAEVLDADPWGETPYVATRYVPGLSLHQHVHDHGPLAGSDLSWFAAGLAEAVSAVHRVGVLHRDIKPSNVLLEGRSPVLIDFGLARLAEDPRLTHTGWLLGTPGYLAPEILYGDDATAASDVHAWAATVVFAATGRPPYGTGPAMAIMDRVRRGQHDLTGVPTTLLPLLRECLSAEPLDRPSVPELLHALDVPARPPGDQATVPFVVGSVRDDATDRLDDATNRFGDLTDPPPRPTVLEPARTPYVQPPAPAEQAAPQPATTTRAQRALVLFGAFALVATGFAWAPYLALVAVAVLALLLRTVSWTTESARDRQLLRGGRRWYDGTLTVVTSPWYLLVATGGTLLMLVWAVALALLVGVAYSLFALPTRPGLLVAGVVVALAVWWGPGSRRLRGPTRRLVRSATSGGTLGWAAVGLVALAVALCGYGLSQGVLWDPGAGAPWRPGTFLGELVGWL